MNKKHLGSVLTGIMVTSLMSPIAPVVAMDEYGYYEPTVMNAYDFVQTYANSYTGVTRENYSVILYGKQIYDTLPWDVQAEVEAIVLGSTGISYGALVDAAYATSMEAYAEEQVLTYQDEIVFAQPEFEETQEVYVEPIEENQNIEETYQEPVEEEYFQYQEETTDEQVEENIGPFAPVINPVVEPVVETVVEPVVEWEEPTEEMEEIEQQDELPAMEEVLFVQNVLEVEAVEEQVQPLDLVSIVAEQESSAEKVRVEKPVNAFTVMQASETIDQNTAQRFVGSFCMANGSVITQVTEENYYILLGGYDSWMALSTSQKNEVNRILMKAGSQTFAKLYNTAREMNGTQQVSLGGVHTSVLTRTWLYSLMCAGSAAMLAFLLKRKAN